MANETNETPSQPEHGTFCWTEIASNDAAACKAFYREVFGWLFKESKVVDDGMEYMEFSSIDDNPVGGLYQIDPKWFRDKPPKPHFMTYVKN